MVCCARPRRVWSMRPCTAKEKGWREGKKRENTVSACRPQVMTASGRAAARDPRAATRAGPGRGGRQPANAYKERRARQRAGQGGYDRAQERRTLRAPEQIAHGFRPLCVSAPGAAPIVHSFGLSHVSALCAVCRCVNAVDVVLFFPCEIMKRLLRFTAKEKRWSVGKIICIYC